jgi:hypothetical protein
MKDGDHLEDPDVDGRIIFKWISTKWDGDMDWNSMFHLHRLGEQWCSTTNFIIIIMFLKG